LSWKVGVVGEVGALAAVGTHHPDLGADAAEARAADRDGVARPRVKQDPVAAGPHDRHLIGSLQPAGQADLLGAVEGRLVDLVRVVAVLVARKRIVPDDVRLIEPVCGLADEILVGLDHEMCRRLRAVRRTATRVRP
jgi:hypothetical protein